MSTDRLTDVPLVSGIVVYWVVRSMWGCRAGCSSWTADASTPSAELLRQPVETGVVYRAEYLTCDQWRIKARSHRNRPKLQQRDHACNYRIFLHFIENTKKDYLTQIYAVSVTSRRSIETGERIEPGTFFDLSYTVL